MISENEINFLEILYRKQEGNKEKHASTGS